METRRFDHKNGRKKRKVREGEGQLLKKVEKEKGRGKREKGRKEGKLEKEWEKGREAEEKGGKERKREKGRLGNAEGCRPATRYRKHRWNNACHFPSTFCTKSDHVRTASEKHKKMREKTKNAHLSRAHTGSSPQTDRNDTFTGPEGNTCSPLFQNSQKNTTKNEKRQFDVQN